MPGKIFVNYRRGDDRSTAARIRDRLALAFGDANVFMDVDNMRPGERFDLKLAEALAQTDVFLAVIGPRWQELLTERQTSGQHDFVREEISAALQLGIVIIPVLIEQTPLPRHDALAGDIRNLVLHQKHVVTHERFGRDVEDLAEAIRLARKTARAGRSGTGPMVRWIGAAALVAVLLLGVGWQFYPRRLTAPGPDARLAEAQSARIKADLEKAGQEQGGRAEEAAAARKKAEDDAEAKWAQEAERRRLAFLKAEQDRAAEEVSRQAEGEARSKAETERKRKEAAETKGAEIEAKQPVPIAGAAPATAPTTKQASTSVTPEEYVARAGGDAKIVPAGELELDGRKAICGQRPTVLDSQLNDYSAAYPGFLILNPKPRLRISVSRTGPDDSGLLRRATGPPPGLADASGDGRGLRLHKPRSWR
jgi:TIR domain